jgi:asparagine synthase (glutamine-hydrolysing)
MLKAMAHEPSYTSGTINSTELELTAGWISLPGSTSARLSGNHTEAGISIALSGEYHPPLLSLDPVLWFLQQYREHGIAFLKTLNGTFSGLLIDHWNKRAFLFNDRYNVARIYTTSEQSGTYYASEAKALLRTRPNTREFDSTALAQYLAFGAALPPRTLFRGIELLENATLLEIASNTPPRKSTYFSPDDWERQPHLNPAEFTEAFYSTFSRILPHYFRNPSEIGIALTGGLDTRLILAFLPSNVRPKLTYTYAGTSDRLRDVRIAGQISAAMSLQHHPIPLETSFLTNFGHFLDRSVYISDGCCNALGAHELYFSKAASLLAPIRITGNFGSEILRSVSTFRRPASPKSIFSPDTLTTLAASDHLVFPTIKHPISFAAFTEIPLNLIGTLLTCNSLLTFRTPYLDNELVQLSYRSPPNLRKSAAFTLRQIKFARPHLASIPTDRGQLLGELPPKNFLRRLSAEICFKLDYYYTDGLPPPLEFLTPLTSMLQPLGVAGTHKFLPYARWFREPLHSFLRSYLLDGQQDHPPLVERKSVEKALHLHKKGIRNYTRDINTLLTLTSIKRCLF